ncbi:MAG: LysM domain-containing protein [Myxococcota bacterium]
MIRTLMLMLGGLAACNAFHPPEAPATPVADALSSDDNPVVIDAALPEGPSRDLPVAIVEPVEVAPDRADEPASIEAGPSEAGPVDGAFGAPPAAIYELRSGETLDHFARWSGTTVEEIAESSALSLGGRHDVGTEVVIAADDDLRATIDAARDAHHALRVDRYLERRGGLVDHATYTVRTGDTAWHVASRNGRLPVWLIEEFNPTLDLDALRPGQALTLPVTADMVPAASDDAD